MYATASAARNSVLFVNAFTAPRKPTDVFAVFDPVTVAPAPVLLM